MKTRILLTLPAVTLLAGNVFAADDAKPARLEEVVVSASKIDISPSLGATQLNDADLAGLRPTTSDTAALLRDVPGVSLYGAGGVSSLPVIHGLNDDRVHTEVDGMSLISACPNHMNSQLSYIDPTQVSSVKVFAGVTPVSVGGDSLGGTVLVESAAPEFAAAGQGTLLKGQAGAFYRSNGDGRGADIAATIANESLSLHYSGSTAKANDYKAASDFKTFTATGRPGVTLPLDVVGSTAYESTNQALDIALRNGNHLFDLKFDHQHIPYEGFPNQRMDMTGNDSDKVNLSYSGQYGWGALKARAYHEETTHEMQFGDDKQYWYGGPLPAILAPGMPMNTSTKTTGASVKADIDLTAKDLLRVGGEYQSYRLDDWWPPSPSSLAGMTSMGMPATEGGMAPNTFWNINGGKRDRLGLFAEWEARWNPQWLSLLGVSTEQVKMDTGTVQGYNNDPMMAGYIKSANAFNALNRQRTDNNVDLTALSRYTPDETRTFEFGLAQKTRSPNLYERYSWSQNSMALVMNNFLGDGNGYLGNPDLKPEVAHTLSATMDLHDVSHAWEFKATPYYTRVTDYIDAIRCFGSGTGMASLCGGAANNTATRQFVQLQYANQSARLYGLDISGRMPLGNTGWGDWGLKGLLNYVNGKNLDTNDGLYNIMPLNAKLTVEQKLGHWSSAAELQMVKAKTDVSSVRQEVQTSGYSLVNLRGSYEWKQVRFDLGVENLFNRFYSLPLGGAYVGQGMTMGTNSIPWGIPVPGMGRSIYTGLNVKF
jgi:iron complex outermembrane receptor protein